MVKPHEYKWKPSRAYSYDTSSLAHSNSLPVKYPEARLFKGTINKSDDEMELQLLRACIDHLVRQTTNLAGLCLSLQTIGPSPSPVRQSIG